MIQKHEINYRINKNNTVTGTFSIEITRHKDEDSLEFTQTEIYNIIKDKIYGKIRSKLIHIAINCFYDKTRYEIRNLINKI